MRSLGAVLTQRGSAFLTAGVILVGAGLLLGQPDLTRIGVLLLTLLAGALWLGRRRPAHFTVTRTVTPARVTVDEPTRVLATVVNNGTRGSTMAIAEEMLDPSLGDRPRFVIPPTPAGDVRELEYSVRPHARGVHRLGPLNVWVRDPFGLVSSPRLSEGVAALVVAPRIHPLGSERSLGRGCGADGSIPHQVALRGEDDQSIREYREGDDLRRIHWPATARTGAIMVRQEDRPAKRRALILLDSHLSGRRQASRTDPGAADFEWSVTMAASIAGHAHDRGYAVHLLTPDASLDAGVRRDEDLDAMLETLARLKQRSGNGLAQIVRAAHALAHDGGLLVALTAAPAESDARALASLRPSGSTGLAFVGAAGRAEEQSAETAITLLRTAGWRATGIRSLQTPMQAWSDLTAAAVEYLV